MKRPAMSNALVAKMEKFTVHLGLRRTPEVVVVAEPGHSLAEAFERARLAIHAERSVCLIGDGVTLPRGWPDWVHGANYLMLAEWGALHSASHLELTGHLQEEMRAWIREVARGAFGEFAADRILFGAACQRFFERILRAYPAAAAIASAFPRAAIFADERSVVERLVHQLGAARSESETGRPPLSWRLLASWRARVLALGVAATTASVGLLVRDRQAARRSFEALGTCRRADASVETWFGLVPDWHRINYHLLEGLALPAVESGMRTGVLLIGTLAPGLRDEQVASRRGASPRLWPGLGKLADRLSESAVEQVVEPDSSSEWLRTMSDALAQSALLLSRLAATPVIQLPSLNIDLTHHARGVVAWATIDLLRASLAHAAARSLCARAPFSGKKVAFVASNSPQLSAVDVVLQDAGATTFDHTHGAGLSGWGIECSESSVRCVWTSADARSVAAPGKRLILTGMPAKVVAPARSRPPRRILLMSSYVHRDSAVDGRYPLEILQAELLDLVPRLRRLVPVDACEFRWRPHPADIDHLIAKELAKHVALELSRGVALETDLAWADVVVSSYSTVVFESLFAGVPVFMHARPELWWTPTTDFIDPERLFFVASDGAEKIARWIDETRATGRPALEAERRARVALFGPKERPVPLIGYFGSASAELCAIGDWAADPAGDVASSWTVQSEKRFGSS